MKTAIINARVVPELKQEVESILESITALQTVRLEPSEPVTLEQLRGKLTELAS